MILTKKPRKGPGSITPQTTDDALTLAEDTPAIINAHANDLNAHQPAPSTELRTGFTPVLVAGLQHGQVVVATDGQLKLLQEWD